MDGIRNDESGISTRRGINMIISESTYKEKPIIVLKRTEEEKYPFSFGIAKAKSILESIEEIQDFVAKHDVPEEVTE